METTPLWSQNPTVLLQAPLEIMYSARYSDVRNLNAMARFVILWVLVSYFVSRRPIVIVLGLIALVLLSRASMSTLSMPKLFDSHDASSRKFCQSPSIDNPMANPTPNDWGSGDVKLPACPTEVVKDNVTQALKSQPITGVGASDAPSLDSNAYLAERSFYSVPASGVPDSRENFIHALYGSNIGRPI
tara:strand:- start:5842 stop:6405 length:564 start_codon:yes stop_codon:yes gene_type:complete